MDINNSQLGQVLTLTTQMKHTILQRKYHADDYTSHGFENDTALLNMANSTTSASYSEREAAEIDRLFDMYCPYESGLTAGKPPTR